MLSATPLPWEVVSDMPSRAPLQLPTTSYRLTSICTAQLDPRYCLVRSSVSASLPKTHRSRRRSAGPPVELCNRSNVGVFVISGSGGIPRSMNRGRVGSSRWPRTAGHALLSGLTTPPAGSVLAFRCARSHVHSTVPGRGSRCRSGSRIAKAARFAAGASRMVGAPCVAAMLQVPIQSPPGLSWAAGAAPGHEQRRDDQSPRQGADRSGNGRRHDQPPRCQPS